MQINIQLLPAVGASHGYWEIMDFNEFLMWHSPRLSSCLNYCLQFPPIHILNEELLSGGRDMGMSGGAYWKAFQITEDEYITIKEEMLTDPKYNLNYDEELAELNILKKWCSKVLTKYNSRKREQSS